MGMAYLLNVKVQQINREITDLLLQGTTYVLLEIRKQLDYKTWRN